MRSIFKNSILKRDLILLIIENILELMESEISLQTIRELLMKMQSEQVSEAEEALKKLTTHPLFFTNIFLILSNPQQQQWVRTMTASFINSMFTENVNEENCESIFAAIVKILMDSNIKQLDKRILQKAIIKVIEVGTDQNRRKWVSLVYQCLKDINTIDNAYLVIACLAVADIPLDLLHSVIHQTYDQIVSGLAVTVTNANLLNEMIKMWIVVFDKLRGEEVVDRAVITRMIGSSCTFSLIRGIYDLQTSDNTLMCSVAGLEQLNLLKYEAGELHKRMLEIELDLSDEAFPFIVDFTKQFIGKIANTLVALAPKRQLINQTGSEDLLTTLFSILRLYLTIKPEEFSLDDAVNIQNHVIFPLILIDDAERHTFQESPEDFNSLAEDCCDKQTFGILKTEAAKLLQKFGDKVDGSLKYSINRALESLKVKMGYVQTHAFSNLPALEIQTSFLVFSIFSYGLGGFPEELAGIRTILNDERTKTLPPLELARVFIFLAYNYAEVYKNPSEGESWLRFVLTYSAHPTAAYCAFDFLGNIVEDYFSESLMDKLTDHISSGKTALIWDIISKIIQNHYKDISGEGVAILINKVFLRIKKQTQELQNGETKHTLDLINSLRTFVNILKEMRREESNNQSASMKKDYIIAKIWPILKFYSQAQKYDIEDEVVKIATEMINTMDSVVPEFTPYLNQYLQAFKKNNYSQKVYLKLFNQYLFKADFERHMNEIIMVLIALKQGLLCFLGKLIDKDGKLKSLPFLRISLSNIIVIIQNAIAIYGTFLLDSNNTDFFHEISSICVRILPGKLEEVEKSASGRIIQSRAFNTLFLCHMHLKIDSIYDSLKLIQSQKLYHGYDTILLAMCISKQIFIEQDISAIVALLSGLIKIAVLSSEKEEQIYKKKKHKNQTKISSTIRTIGDLDKILASIDSPFKKCKDLSEVLTQMFCSMKKSNLELFNAILAALPHQDFNNYQHFVNFQQLQKKRRVFVKVIDVKRSEATLIHNESTEMKDSDQEEHESLKRQRMKAKVEHKMQKKKQHKEE